jgi:hypothetical protein
MLPTPAEPTRDAGGVTVLARDETDQRVGEEAASPKIGARPGGPAANEHSRGGERPARYKSRFPFFFCA